MKQKQYSTEEIIRILRQSDTDQTVESICRESNISKATFHRWKRKYGDMDIADAKRLKELEKENAELKKMLAESMLENRVLRASGVLLSGFASVNLSVFGQTASASTGPVASAHCRSILAPSTLWLSAYPCAVSSGRLAY